MTASVTRRPCSSPPESKPMLLEAAHISKRFGSRPQVLTDVSFGVEPGEFVSVIGPSGAGKTTLFRILNGTLPCDGGEVCIDGQPFSRARGRAKRAVQKRIGTKRMISKRKAGELQGEAVLITLQFFAETSHDKSSINRPSLCHHI